MRQNTLKYALKITAILLLNVHNISSTPTFQEEISTWLEKQSLSNNPEEKEDIENMIQIISRTNQIIMDKQQSLAALTIYTKETKITELKKKQAAIISLKDNIRNTQIKAEAEQKAEIIKNAIKTAEDDLRQMRIDYSNP